MFIDPLGLYDLEKDEEGRVYAIIEEGDTLSEISYSEVGDANAWTKIGYDGDPSKIQVGQKIDITNLYENSNSSPKMIDATKNSDVPPSSSGYLPPKGGPKWNKEKGGWEDKHGNVWIPDKYGHGEGRHWDVQYPNGGYDNVYDDGHVRAGKGKRGMFSPKTVNVATEPNAKVVKNSNDVVKTGLVTLGIYGIYNLVKWGIATLAASATCGMSYAGAAVIP